MNEEMVNKSDAGSDDLWEGYGRVAAHQAGWCSTLWILP